jgi:thiamine biosynthesis lipoprotein
MDESEQIARRMAALRDLGLKQVPPPPVTTEVVPLNRKSVKVTVAQPAMSTLVAVTAIHRSQDLAEEAIGRAFEEMNRLIGILNRFDDSTALSSLNSEGRLRDTPPELVHLIQRSARYHEVSSGLFDISVRPLVDLFQEKLTGSEPREPTDSEIRDAMQRVGFKSVAISGPDVELQRDGMSLTLDGIAKGFIVDAIAESLTRGKVRNYLVNAGGDIRTSGRREYREPWRVAVQDPEKQDNYPEVLPMTKGAVATSGSYEIFYDQERMYHHIVDSTSGRSPTLHASVTVRAPTALAADALATTLYLLNPAEGVRLIESLRGCECLLIDRAGGQVKSSGWNR